MTKPKATTAATKPAAKPAVATTTTVSPADRIAELLERRTHLLELRDLTEAAPRSLAEARADVPKVIELLAAKVDPQVAWLAQGPTGFADLARQLGAVDQEYGPIPAASLMAWCMPSELAERIELDLAASYDSLPRPMTSAAKAAELNRLGREIATVEAELAQVWWAAVDSGLQLDLPPIDGATLIGLTDR